MEFPLHLGQPWDGLTYGFAHPRALIDARGELVGVIDSDEGPALFGEIAKEEFETFLEEGLVEVF